MKRFFKIFLCIECVLILFLGLVWVGASGVDEKKCVKWEIIVPTPTPIPLSHIYTEWIPMPGTSPGTGHGWIKATELKKATSTWHPRDILTPHVLRDVEYAAIEEEYGLRMTRGGKWGYGFPPRQGFPSLYGGVILKNEWLPERLQSPK